MTIMSASRMSSSQRKLGSPSAGDPIGDTPADQDPSLRWDDDSAGEGARDRPTIDDDQLAAILVREEAAAVGFGDGELAEQQRIAVDAYYGRPYGDEEAGRSQFVTRDVAEAVDYMTVAVLRAFVSGDHVVEFEGHPKAREVTAAIACSTIG